MIMMTSKNRELQRASGRGDSREYVSLCSESELF